MGARAVLTLGLWLSAMTVFGVAGVVMEGQWASWNAAWLGGLALTGLILSLLLARLIEALDAAPAWLGWPLLGLSVATAAVLQSVLDFSVLRWAQQLSGARVTANITYAISFNLLVYVWLFALYAAAVKLQRANARAREHERQLLEARAAGDRARLDALRYQVNPHFLFNTLNGLQTLIAAERKAQALAMLRHLSAFLRSSLDGETGDMVPLAAELDALEAYLEVERARFGERLQVTIDCADALGGAQVPHLILQPLVENVMTHVVARTSAPVRVDIRCRAEAGDLLVEVADSGAPDAPAAEGLGLGLANVRSRLRLLFGEGAGLDCGRRGAGFRAVVRLPLRLEPA